MQDSRILIVDDNPGVLSAGKLFLKRHFGHVTTLSDPEQLPALLSRDRFDVILLDMNFTKSGRQTGSEGLSWLEKILETDPKAVVVLITAFGDVELAVQAIKKGAADFVLKPWDNEKLLATLLAALRLKQVLHTNERLESTAAGANLAAARDLPGIIFRSDAMKIVMETVSRVAETDANILILGENGTGKDLIAQAIHTQSQRAARNFVKVDLGALTESLFESELFGHVKGAFTDARDDRPGRFEAAHGGTLFLDEIGNLPLHLQSKLLTVLQTRTVTRVGDNKSIPTDVRVVSATNQNLDQMVNDRLFRQDLLYRINTIEIQLPALRHRPEDIEPLARHFLKEYARKYQRPALDFDQAVLRELHQYPWPGNIRELRHTLERAVILSDKEILRRNDFLFKDNPAAKDQMPMGNMNLEEMEKQLVRKAMEKHHGNISEAARELGITRAALYRRLEKHDL